MDIFQISLLQMSLSASVLIMVAAAIRVFDKKAGYKIPKITFLALWCVALVRLLVPIMISVPVGVYTALGSNVNALPVLDGAYFFLAPAMTEGGPVSHVQAQIPILQVIWAIGMAVCASFFLISHIRCRREYKSALPVRDDFIENWRPKIRRTVQIRQSDRIHAPMTYGLWKPFILFPKDTDWQDKERLGYILAHELTHIKRFDILVKWLLAAALCVHWFNPLVWLMYILANRDIEIRCDEAVVWELLNTCRKKEEKIRSAYALALIGLEEKKSGYPTIAALGNSFAENAIKERIVSIMKIKKTSFIGKVLAFAIVATLTVGGLTAFAAPPADYYGPFEFSIVEVVGSFVPLERAGIFNWQVELTTMDYGSFSLWVTEHLDSLRSSGELDGQMMEALENRFAYALDMAREAGHILVDIESVDITDGRFFPVMASTIDSTRRIGPATRQIILSMMQEGVSADEIDEILATRYGGRVSISPQSPQRARDLSGYGPERWMKLNIGGYELIFFLLEPEFFTPVSPVRLENADWFAELSPSIPVFELGDFIDFETYPEIYALVQIGASPSDILNAIGELIPGFAFTP